MKTETSTFTNEIQEILGKCNVKTINRDNTVIQAKANISSFVTMTQFELLTEVANNYGLMYAVKRSGAGLLIEFKTDL
ncbi:MAG TPA: hypothetical protein DHV22_18730 [Xanthomarina gelatinilytica]|uniref:Uncharacterized protein n=1 Tax=Xanthomarina gelatinilytica TaxID=1137281 RepID=A0A3D6BW76_9FLAO|nr:hypothetical protein [Xanthomarina gelatinilytica]